MTAPQPWPLLAVGAVLLARGFRIRSSQICAAASIVVTCGLWLLLSQTRLSGLQLLICANLLWVALAAIGMGFHDPFALTLRVLVAAMFPVATLFAIAGEPVTAIPILARGMYVVLLAVVCLLIAWFWRNLWFLYGFGGMVGVSAYTSTVSGFHRATAVIGREAMTAFVWSSGHCSWHCSSAPESALAAAQDLASLAERQRNRGRSQARPHRQWIVGRRAS